MNPEAGDLIVGSGGCRKLRLAGRGKGKSGGYRVVTFYVSTARPVYAIAVLSKGSRATFTAAEVAAMAGFARRIVTGETVAEALALDLKVGPWGLSKHSDIQRMAALGVFSSTVSGPDWG